jgi:hypothetical protein
MSHLHAAWRGDYPEMQTLHVRLGEYSSGKNHCPVFGVDLQRFRLSSGFGNDSDKGITIALLFTTEIFACITKVQKTLAFAKDALLRVK